MSPNQIPNCVSQRIERVKTHLQQLEANNLDSIYGGGENPGGGGKSGFSKSPSFGKTPFGSFKKGAK